MHGGFLQGRSSFSKMAAAGASMMAVLCVTALAARQHTAGVNSKLQRAILVQKAIDQHGTDTVSAAIHVKLDHLTSYDKQVISKLSTMQREELQGQIMLEAAEQTLAEAAAQKKQQHPMLKQQALKSRGVHQMLQEANATNGTNGTEAEAEADNTNVGAFDLTAWLNSQPDPRLRTNRTM